MIKSQFDNNFIDSEAINKQQGEEPLVYGFGPSTLRDDQGRVTYEGPIFIANFNGLGITTAEKLKRLLELTELNKKENKNEKL